MRETVRWSLNLAVTLLVTTTLVLLQTSFGRTQTQPEELGNSTYPVWSPTGQLIAFESTIVKTEVYVVNPDGSARRKLTTSPSSMQQSVSPAWSPDGGRIVFVTGYLREGQINVMNSDGSDQRQLVSGNWNEFPVWSPDGRSIAFRGKSELFVMAPDGSRQTSVTVGMPAVTGFSWAPDSRRIVVSTYKTEWVATRVERGGVVIIGYTAREESQIHLVNADGDAKRALTNITPSRDDSPTWSHDGNRIIFVSTRDGSQQIYIMNPDGSGQTRLTSAGKNVSPVWSPDGRRMAFLSDRDGAWQIYVMNADGSQQTRLTSVGENKDPTWSPDGRRIAFASKRGALWKIYVINSDGTGEAQSITGP